ncbi:MAG: FHA domain-containing serine/threonine-protein kinase [Chloroflexota bacterium]
MKQLIGQVINNFEIQEVIGEGSMGIVYRAFHPDLQRYTAIKVLRPEMIDIPDSFERFLQEARTAAQLQHENIVNVINFGEIEESYYLMMEYVEGASMRELIEENPEGIDISDVAVIFSQITDVLSFAHDQGILHRDLKPDNILLTFNPEEHSKYQAMVSDFGLVKIASGGLTHTMNGMTLGTPAYMSPEQCTGIDTDVRTDIYSLGVTMYEAVTGKRPYPIRNLFDAVKFHSSGKLVPPKALNPNVPTRLNVLIRQMLNTDPNNRPISAEEVKHKLSRFLPNSGSLTDSQMLLRIKQGMKLTANEESKEKAFAQIREETIKEVSKPVSRCIVVSYEGRIESVHPPLIVGEKLIVGRSSMSDIVLGRQERYVSKKHCEIEVLDDKVVLRDLNSTNGTFLGTTRLTPLITYDWENDNEINLGGYKLSLRQLKDDEPITPDPPEEEQTIIQGQYLITCNKGEPEKLILYPNIPIVIGRLPDCELVLPSGRVSKKHVQIELQDSQVVVTDLNSTNGSVINGHRLLAGKQIAWDGNAPLCIADYEIELSKNEP